MEPHSGLTERNHVRGDVREDGKIFWRYEIRPKDHPTWVTPERFKEKNDRRRTLRLENKEKYPILTIKERYRNRLGRAIAGIGYTKNGSSRELLGCSWEELKEHLESHFVEGMCWSRRWEIDIDHHIPLATAKTLEDIVALSHYTNLRPLFRKVNQSKGSRMPEDFYNTTKS